MVPASPETDPAVDAAARAVVRSVRTVDADSRARTHLANERTFLAWLRTGLSLVALGIATAHFLETPGQPVNLPAALGLALAAGGTVMAAAGGKRFLDGTHMIEAGTYRPHPLAVVLSVALVAAAGAAAIAFILLLG